MKIDLNATKPTSVDDLRDYLWNAIGVATMPDIDDMLEYIWANKDLLEKWADEHLV